MDTSNGYIAEDTITGLQQRKVSVLTTLSIHPLIKCRLYADVDIVQKETSSAACIPEDVTQDTIKEFGQEVGREVDKGDEVDEVVDNEQEIDGVDDGIDVQMDGYAED